MISLSGGNQQKVVIAKWLLRDCDILIFDEPTRGIDVGAKAEIYRLLEDLAGQGKAIIVINPAEPPLIMRDTIHCLLEDDPDEEAITRSIHQMVAEVQKYVPGYTLKNGPVFDGKRVSVWMEVAGLGDFLPKYAGNLDIMTAAAARTAEMFAEEILKGELVLEPSMA